MKTSYRKKLERNVWLYAVMNFFRLRVYLPLITVYAVAHAGVSLEQIGIIAAITAAGSLAMEIPSGYLSDRMGHKRVLLVGSFFIAIAPLGYILFPNFFGILFGLFAYFSIGIAFHSGTAQAFLHETLSELDRAGDFAKVTGRVQSIGLVGNIVLIALVPLTYGVDPRLPFLIGFFLQSMVLIATVFMTPPRRAHEEVREDVREGFFSLLSVIRARKEFLCHLQKTLAQYSSKFLARRTKKCEEYRDIVRIFSLRRSRNFGEECVKVFWRWYYSSFSSVSLRRRPINFQSFARFTIR